MALAFYVEDRRPDTLATAFAAHDEYLSIFTHFISGQQRKHKHDSNTSNANDNDNANANAPCMILTPAHDYYTAPYCFMPKNDRAGFLVFTAQVPWLHGNPLANADNNNNDDDDGNNNNNNNNGEQNNHGRRKQNNDSSSNDDDDNNNNNQRRQQQRQRQLQCHQAAHEWQDARGKFEAPHVGSVESFQRALSLREREVYTFTETGCYPDRDDVSQSLEDRAVRVTCDAMGWEMPKNWRAARRKMSRTHSPILNLADWDSRKKRKNRDDDDDDDGNDIADAGSSSNDSNHHNVTITTNEKGENNANDRRPSHDVRQEEKKDSAEEYHQC